MDSLLMNYASSDEEGDAEVSRTFPPPKLPSFSNSVPPEASRSLLSSLPPPKASPSLLSSLPPPKASPSLLSSLPPPKASPSLLSSLPPPVASASSSSSPSSSLFSSLAPPKPHLPNHFLNDVNIEDDEGKPSRPPLSSMFSFLPPPKNSLTNALFSIPVPNSQSGKQSNKLASDQNPKKIVCYTSPLNPSMLKSQDSDSDDNEEEKRRKARKDASSSFTSKLSSLIPAPKNSLCIAPAQSSNASRRSSLQAVVTSENSALELKAEKEEIHIASSSNYCAEEGMAAGYYDTSSYSAEQNVSDFVDYTNNAGNWTGSVVDPGAISNPAITCWEQDNCSIVSQVDVPYMGRITGKRGRTDIPSEIVEVKQDELMKNRPREDQVKLTGIAFGPAYQPAPSGKGKPSKLHKRKHQIGSLFYDLKQKEMELAERRSKGLLTKAETQAKYGW